MNREQLINDIWRVCDILCRDNNCSDVMECVEHFYWLMFLKFLDVQENFFEIEAQLASQSYTRIIGGQYRWSNWVPLALGKKLRESGRRAMPEWDGEQLMKFVRGELIPHLASLSGSPEREVIARAFSDRNVIVCASHHNFKDVLEIIDGIDFQNSDDTDTVSFVYKDLLKQLSSKNKMAGEFYTPRPVIQFMVEVIDPKIGETVYDPACGSGGFLVEAFLQMHKQKTTPEELDILQSKTFSGQELRPLPNLLCTMNMMLHGFSLSGIRRLNTLEKNIQDVSESFDVVLTNPPFGTVANTQLQQELAVKADANELLFLKHIMETLKRRNGSRCGIVVPERILFQDGAFATVKQELLNDFNLLMVVSLPPGTFAPYSDVKTAILFFEQPGRTQEVLYYELPMPEGRKQCGKDYAIADEHFVKARQMYDQWKAYRQNKALRPKITENSWFETVETLAERGYDLTARNPNKPVVEKVPHPAELTARLLEKNLKFQSILERLDKMVRDK